MKKYLFCFIMLGISSLILFLYNHSLAQEKVDAVKTNEWKVKILGYQTTESISISSKHSKPVIPGMPAMGTEVIKSPEGYHLLILKVKAISPGKGRFIRSDSVTIKEPLGKSWSLFAIGAVDVKKGFPYIKIGEGGEYLAVKDGVAQSMWKVANCLQEALPELFDCIIFSNEETDCNLAFIIPKNAIGRQLSFGGYTTKVQKLL
jgi:hypothetical protein